MKRNQTILTMTLAGLLCAIGVLIPMISPIKVVLEPASFTLASHVAVFLAMFLSPQVGAAVALGTTLGFLLGGFPLVVVLRALSHVIFALLGGWYLQSRPQLPLSLTRSLPFSLVLGLLHGACEVLVVLPFYLGGSLGAVNYEKGFFVAVFLLVGVGSAIHSMVDFALSVVLWKPVRQVLHRMAPQMVPALPAKA